MEVKRIMSGPKRLVAGVVILVLVSWAIPASADIPNEFKNLKVFPKDVGKRELVDAMRGWSQALGVRCTHCHVLRTPGDYDTMDWASDEIKDKETARGMMRMVQKINGDLLPATGETKARVSCMTCHRGLTDPATLDRVLLKVAHDKGADAVVEQYRALRERYHGSGSYDFGPGTLLTVAEELAGEDQLEVALAVLDLNVEAHPGEATNHVMIAQVKMQQGDSAAARAAVARALELEPDNNYAKRLLAQIDASP